jgi:DNA-binding transcriptional ArsR family regulator
MEQPHGGRGGSDDDSGSESASSGATASDSASRRGGQVDDVLVALADPTRRRLLDLLAARGDVTATVLAQELPVTRQAVVKHLAVLDAAGLVTSHKVGREVRFAVRPSALDETARWMSALAADWDRRLARIKRIAEAAEAAEREAG